MASSPLKFPRGRELVLGVGAGIAAYKSCELLRRLQDHGFLVTVVPTPTSLNFVGKATWEALSGRPVLTQLWEGQGHVSHVEIANTADLVVIAPATADLISRIAQGRADDLLTTTILATSAPLIAVPAMHPGMWLNPATQSNVELLRSRGIQVMEPETGRLTGEDSGIGRFPEIGAIVDQVLKLSGNKGALLDKKILVTTGGTKEPIDPVRYIGNRSSGIQGLAVAYQAIREGAEVTVIAADTVPFDLEGARVIKADTADEMLHSLKQELPSHDALVMAAAVADARPSDSPKEKIKKEVLENIHLTANPDLLATVSETRRPQQLLVGFAAETSPDYEQLGLDKLRRKGVDLVYVTDVAHGRVFGESTTSGSLLDKNGVLHRYVDADKFAVARDLIGVMSEALGARNG